VAKQSVYRQVQATAIASNSLKDSPRHWNNGLFRFDGRLWMSYRFHLMTASGRCKTAICQLDESTLQPCAPSQMLDLPETNGDEHMEDARLFTFKGQPYVSYTEMTGYRPGVDFKCVMKYARVSLRGNRWKVHETFLPRYGRNDWKSKEKNWIFFEEDGRLYTLYQTDPDHRVLELDGEKVIREYVSARPVWEWGTIRGGTPPVRLRDGTMLAIFHSSLPTEKPPAYVRYFAGAYRLSGKPPFQVLGISPRPILSASEEDGHKVDPRYIDGWKPYVVFPCGLVDAGQNYLVSFGINDWQSAIARLPVDSIDLVAADGSEVRPRYFMRANGSVPFHVMTPNRAPKTIMWIVPSPGPGSSAGCGYVKITSQRDAEEIADQPGVTEIAERDYERAIAVRVGRSMFA
jgi:predicted GH43/DUF377 family glycosyl hydrolase